MLVLICIPLFVLMSSPITLNPISDVRCQVRNFFAKFPINLFRNTYYMVGTFSNDVVVSDSIQHLDYDQKSYETKVFPILGEIFPYDCVGIWYRIVIFERSDLKIHSYNFNDYHFGNKSNWCRHWQYFWVFPR